LGLQNSFPNDPDVLRALAAAQGARGSILSETPDIHGAVDSLRAEVATYDRLIALPGVTASLYLEDCAATSVLGDVLGQDTGLSDVQAALTAYRHCLDLDRRAVALDPNSIAAKRGLANMQMKVGNAELDLDPNLALGDFQLALQEFDALPVAQQTAVSTQRLRGITLRKVATADSELGDYAQAIALIEAALTIHQRLADADPKDIRNMGDLYRAFEFQASMYESAANPALSAAAADRPRSLQLAEASLRQALASVDGMLRQIPGDIDRQAERANLQVRIADCRHELHEADTVFSDPGPALEKLRSLASSGQASPHVVSLAFTSWFEVEPASLRSPEYTLTLAQRLVALTHRKAAEGLLALAEAFRAAGKPDQSRTVALEGLALLPSPKMNTPIPRIRKLLSLEANDPSKGTAVPGGAEIF